MPIFTTHLLKTSGEAIVVSVKEGESLFVVGANGAGKSSLMHRFFTTHQQQSRRISAHRQNWFSSNAVTLSPGDKRQTETNIKNQDTNLEARWKDDHSSQRASIAIYDLIDAENVRARAIADAVDRRDFNEATNISTTAAPLRIINEVLQLSNIPIEVSVHQNEQVLASRRGGPTYSVAELSDGERNALLIAATVLTVPAGTLLLIDEPERHLHRSIISPLLRLLFERRANCAFIISTHDISLPLDTPSSKTLLVRECVYSGKSVNSWDVDLVDSSVEIDEGLKREIIGSRKSILFVEGKSSSLDMPLYSLVFPQVSVVAKSSCREVMNAVAGIRGAQSLLWIKAHGIIDRDGRTQEAVDELVLKGVYPLSVFSVESIYYHPEMQRRVTNRQVQLVGGDVDQLLEEALRQAITELRPNARRLSLRVMEHKLRSELEKQMPTSDQISNGNQIAVNIDTGSLLQQQIEIFNEHINHSQITELISKYPVRETGALGKIATCLRFQNRSQYESAVRKLLADDLSAVHFVRTLFGDLPNRF
jgi:ABC-type cobalamin/Fe3+-siderophores transport system ATPase subunit